MDDNKRAWLYCRVANLSEAVNALELQERQLQEYCTQKDIEIIGITKYQGSGLQISDALRNTVLPKAEQGEFDILLCTKADRIGRNTNQVFDFIKEINELGVSVCDMHGEFDCFMQYWQSIEDNGFEQSM